MQTCFMQFAVNVIHLIKKLEYAEYSECAVSLYLGCCSGVHQSTLIVLIKSTLKETLIPKFIKSMLNKSIP